MSGTSADGIDAALIQSDGQGASILPERLCFPYRDEVQRAVIAARSNPADFLADPHRRTALQNGISEDHAEAVKALRAKTSVEIDLIGFHGQTIYHNPSHGRTIQLGDGHLLARRVNIPVIYDFRAADMEAGGQGAPLAPIYHAVLLRQSGLELPACFLNIGGVANLSFVADNMPSAHRLLGFDTCPGNGMIDDLAQRYFNRAFAPEGSIAGTGTVHEALVEQMLQLPYFKLEGPRSLDRASFNKILDWPAFLALSPTDKIATLTAFTAASICLAIQSLPASPKHIVLAGGGVHNRTLINALKRRLPDAVQLVYAEEIGADSDNIEAELIGLLAARYHFGLPSTFPSTTGVSSPQICGKKCLPR